MNFGQNLYNWFLSNAQSLVLMAIAVIGGLISSTILSLLFVPVIYTFIDDLKKALLPRLAKLTSVTKADRDVKEW